MLTQDKGETFRSNPRDYAAASTVDIDMQFLRPALRWRAPVVRELIFHLRCTFLASGGAALATDTANLLAGIVVRDPGGDIVNVSGKGLRVINQLELGTHYVEQDTVTSGSTATDYDIFLRVVFDPRNAHRGADTALPVPFLTEGGAIQVTFGAAANVASVTGSLRVYAEVHDERRREAKARMVWLERTMSASEDDYPVMGSLRHAIHTSNLGATTGYSSLAGITQVDSRALQILALDPAYLRSRYRRLAGYERHTADAFVAATPVAIPILHASQGQHIGKMPDLKSFDYKIEDAAPTSSRIITCVITDRLGDPTARWLGFGSFAEYGAAMEARGKVITGSGSSPIDKWDPKLTRRLALAVE